MFPCLCVYTHNIPIKAIKIINHGHRMVLTESGQQAASLHISPHSQGGCCHHCPVAHSGEALNKQRLSALAGLSQGIQNSQGWTQPFDEESSGRAIPQEWGKTLENPEAILSYLGTTYSSCVRVLWSTWEPFSPLSWVIYNWGIEGNLT